MDKRSIFKIYNSLRKDSKEVPTITLSRLNKALGIVMSKKYDRPYYTTMSSCTCPDAIQRGFFVCKHRLALMLKNPQETLELRFLEEGPWDPIYKEKSDV